MGTNFQSIITEFDNDFTRKILGQTFSNESIVSQKLFSTSITNTEFKNCKFENVDFTGSYLKTCTFNHCTFRQTIFHKCEFWDCSFKNCQINQCQFTKADFYTNIFDHSYLQKIDSSWSYFGTCSFYETNISDIDFTGAIIDNLVLKETTFSNLKVSETFPVKFSKSGKLTEVTDSCSLENLINSIR
jgi:uncharacterized protein YjbI with pentapeptide repeats